ncbi:uncharacterized protein LOC125948276 [Anopheles darlingi]|uniref:uncharacterized protein LOC125948276 n=1 Tax=Anopheles darlingi TaxID=43151 RepID=UPI002100193E|nr:uncharacterized protein LOC125948276 [Anopheles darlingi]
MVVNSVRGVVSYLGSGAGAPDAARALDRSHLTSRWNPAMYSNGPSGPSVPLGPGYTTLDGGGGPSGGGGGGSFYHHPMMHQNHPLVGAADGSHGYGMRFSSGEGYGGSSSAHGGYDYHPPPPPIHTPPIFHSHPPVHLVTTYSSGGHSSIGKSHRGGGKGAALSALTLLAFLYFLNMLQSCLKEHMATMNPTVMVMTAGATRRKDIATVTEQDRSSDESHEEQESDEDGPADSGDYDGGGGAAAVERYEAISRRYQLLTSSNHTLNPYVKPSTRSTIRKRIPETPSRNQEQQQQQQEQWRQPTTVRKRPVNRYGPDHAGSDWHTSERGRH